MLAALAVRLDAAPSAASTAVARQYADALTGVNRDEPARAGPRWPWDADPAPAGDGDGDNARRLAGDQDASASADEHRGDAEADDAEADDNEADDDDASSDDSAAAEEPGEPTGLAGVGAADIARLVPGDDDGDAADASGSGTGELALRDAEWAPPDAELSTEADAASAQAGATEMYEAWMRRIRPSWWGRLDFGVAWRQRWSEPRYAPPSLHHELWLVATWRR